MIMRNYMGDIFCWMKTDEGTIGFCEASSLGIPPGSRNLPQAFRVTSHKTGAVEEFTYKQLVGSFDNLEFKYQSKTGIVIHISND
jgi:hypothetical protein